jgi:hypothetical protein
MDRWIEISRIKEGKAVYIRKKGTLYVPSNITLEKSVCVFHKFSMSRNYP